MKIPFLRNQARPPRHPVKGDSFRKLKEIGAPVGAVLDVGVKTSTDALIEAFPDRPHLLMEPIVEWNEAIARNYDRASVAHEIVNAAISDSDGETLIKTSSVYEDAPISHAQMVDAAPQNSKDGARAKADAARYRTVPMRRLDTLVAERALPAPYLLKIDIDGAEMSVLAGAKKTLAQCSVVVIETGITNMVERAAAVQAAGFQIFDIVDLCYYDGRFVQADMVFLSYQAIKDHKLSVYRDGFDVARWRGYAPA